MKSHRYGKDLPDKSVGKTGFHPQDGSRFKSAVVSSEYINTCRNCFSYFQSFTVRLLHQDIRMIVLGVPRFLFAKYVLLPAAEFGLSGISSTMSYAVELVENFSETIKLFLLTDVVLFSIITFLIVVLLKYGRKMYKVNVKSLR